VTCWRVQSRSCVHGCALCVRVLRKKSGPKNLRKTPAAKSANIFLCFFVCKGARERPICTRAPFPWCQAKPCAPSPASMIRVSISRETAQGRSKTGEEVRPCVLGGIGPFSFERRATAPMTRRRASLRHWRICKMATQKGSPGLRSVRRKNTRRKGEQRAATSQHLQPARARRRAGHARVAWAHWRRQPQPRAKHFFPVKMRVCTWRLSPRRLTLASFS
jgi:hypothetical protein